MNCIKYGTSRGSPEVKTLLVGELRSPCCAMLRKRKKEIIKIDIISNDHDSDQM